MIVISGSQLHYKVQIMFAALALFLE